MSTIKLQGKSELARKIYYEFDSSGIPLGVGGMGTVYKGKCINEQTGQSRDVAIKFLYEDLPENVIARARREASIQLRNDNLVEMLGFVEVEGKDMLNQKIKRYHVVSEYLEGVTLEDLLEGKHLDNDGNLVAFASKWYGQYKGSENDRYHFAVQMTRNILSGIMALHDGGYIHRDIDPSNVMVTSDGHVKLIDFGIAKRVDSLNTNDKSFTISGQFIGKAKYAAPEQVLGDINHQNVTTDIYSVGIMLFQFITGHVPFEGAMHEVIDMQLHKKLPLHQIKQHALRKVIAKATAKKQSSRYQSAAEFRVDLDKMMTLDYPEKSTIVKSLVYAACLLIVAGGGWTIVDLTTGSERGQEADSGMTINTISTKQESKAKSYSYEEVYALLCSTNAASMKEGYLLLDSLVKTGH